MTCHSALERTTLCEFLPLRLLHYSQAFSFALNAQLKFKINANYCIFIRGLLSA